MLLELDDIQGTVLNNRPMPYFGAYVAFSIEDATAARTMLKRLIPRITSCADWAAPKQNAWLNIAFTWEGLRRLGLNRNILEGFPVEFRQGMAARSAFLGDVGRSDPSLWDFPHGQNGFHAGLLVMASTAEGREEMLDLGRHALDGLDGIEVAAHLNVGVPPTMREHFGFVDGISRPFIEGQGGEPLPGQGDPTKAGEFILGYENELGELAKGPGPEVLWRNGTYAAIRKIYQDVAAFRTYLRQSASSAAGEEKVAAKMMGRWRSGCPLALSPDVDDPSIVADPQRNNAFAYYEDDLNGAKTPVGCHIRRVNPRDGLQDTMAYARLHQLLRRGAAYGPLLPEGVMADDGEDRGIVLALINANPGRQFEFVQSQWVNDGDFVSQGLRSDPVVGRRDRSDDFAFPDKPVRRRLTGLPDFTATRGGEHVFLPSISALKWLSEMQGNEA